MSNPIDKEIERIENDFRSVKKDAVDDVQRLKKELRDAEARLERLDRIFGPSTTETTNT